MLLDLGWPHSRVVKRYHKGLWNLYSRFESWPASHNASLPLPYPLFRSSIEATFVRQTLMRAGRFTAAFRLREVTASQ